MNNWEEKAKKYEEEQKEVSAPETPELNFADLAKSGFGDAKMRSHLYETGLQNIFNDYQENIEMLSKQEKSKIEDAYYIKEMSKKYLGEYASNTEMGDVSGNLLDIYGRYQENIADITKQKDELEFGLQQKYQAQRQELLSNKMMADYDVKVGELGQHAQNIMQDIISGNTGNLNDFEYLNAHKDELGSMYGVLWQSLYSSTLEEIHTNIERGWYGVDEQGERITDIHQYLDKYKGIIKDSTLDALKVYGNNPKMDDFLYGLRMNDFGEYDNLIDYYEGEIGNFSLEEQRIIREELSTHVKTEIENSLPLGQFDLEWKDKVDFKGNVILDEDGNPEQEAVFNTDRKAYIEKYRPLLSDFEYDQYMKIADIYDQQDEIATKGKTYTSMDRTIEGTSDESGKNLPNKHYTGNDLLYDEGYFWSGEEPVHEKMAIYTDAGDDVEGTQRYWMAKNPVSEEKNREINEEFNIEYEGQVVNPGDSFYSKTDQTLYYRYLGEWHKLIADTIGTPSYDVETMKDFPTMNKEKTFEYKGVKYKEQRINGERYYIRDKELKKELEKLGLEIHGSKKELKNKVIFYEGKFYRFGGKEFYFLEREKEEF